MFRISFTRVGGQGAKDGWQAVNIPPDLPPETAGRYVLLQNSNTALKPEFDAEDTDEKIVTELTTDSRNAYLSRIKYGLADEQGRPSMFADSFIVSLKDFIENPWGLLGIKNENFRFDLSEGRGDAVEKFPDPEISDALSELNLDSRKFAVLLKCVYAVLNRKIRKSLEIVCGADYCGETIAKTMYCIYSALFFPFRKGLTFSTYELKNALPKTIVFSRSVREGTECYFELESGKTDIQDSVLKRFDELGFIDEIADYPETATSGYFKSFEVDLREYGCAESTSLNLYKLVWESERVKIAELPDSDLPKKLNELLSIDVPNQKIIHERITEVFLRITERGVRLNDILAGKIAKLPQATNNPILANLCKACIYRENLESVPQGGLENFARGMGEAIIEYTENTCDQPVIEDIVFDDEYEENKECQEDNEDNEDNQDNQEAIPEKSTGSLKEKVLSLFGKRKS